MPSITHLIGGSLCNLLPKKPKLGADFPTDWARGSIATAIRTAAIEGITRPIIAVIARPSIKGIDRLDELEGPVIFAANHNSHLDTSLLLSCLPVRFRHRSVVAAGADYFFDKYWKSILWALWINIIPIEREKVGRRSADLASRLIGDGWNLVIFPEGSRGDDEYVTAFRGGAAYLGIKCDVPVVPVHIEGTRQIFGKGARRVSPGRTVVTFGSPLQAAEKEKGREFNARIEKAVALAADETSTDWWSALKRHAHDKTPALTAPPGLEGWRRSWTASARRNAPKERQWPNVR